MFSRIPLAILNAYLLAVHMVSRLATPDDGHISYYAVTFADEILTSRT